MQTLRELCLDTIVEKKMSLVDAGKTAVMTMRWRLLAGRSKLNSYSNRKRTAANSRQFDGRYDQAAGLGYLLTAKHDNRVGQRRRQEVPDIVAELCTLSPRSCTACILGRAASAVSPTLRWCGRAVAGGRGRYISRLRFVRHCQVRHSILHFSVRWSMLFSIRPTDKWRRHTLFSVRL